MMFTHWLLTEVWFFFTKFLCWDFYKVNFENSWHFRNSSMLTSNFQMLIKFLSLTLGVWFFLCKPIFIWYLSMCPNFLKNLPTKRVDWGGLLGPPLCLISKNYAVQVRVNTSNLILSTSTTRPENSIPHSGNLEYSNWKEIKGSTLKQSEQTTSSGDKIGIVG